MGGGFLRRFLQSLRSGPGSIRSLPDRTPLRVQLVVVLLVLMMLALAFAAAAANAALRGYLLTRVDDRLQDTANGALNSGRFPGGLQGDGPPDRSFNGPALTEGFFSQVVDASGVGKGILRVPTGSSQTGPQLPTLDLSAVQSRDGRPFTVDAERSGDDWRILVVALPNNAGGLVVGTSLTDVSSTIGRLIVLQSSIGVIVLILLGVAGSVIVRSALRKLSTVEQTAGAIAGGDLSKRIELANDRTEVGRLGTALNTMLSTIETLFAARQASEAEARESEMRMRRFVGDASHELRTPLTSIRGFAELQRQAADLTIEERNRLNERIEAESKRMGLLVEDLLLLARLDHQRPLEQDALDIGELLDDVVADAPVLGPEHVVVRIPDAVPEDILVLGDRPRLRQVLSNLLNNAYVHTPAGSRVEVSSQVGEETVSIVVADNGPGLSDDDAARVFERFFRSDPSRTRASGGSGLGLSIVAAIVAAHGGTITVATTAGSGATFTVVLPRVRVDDELQHDDIAAPDVAPE